MPLTKGDRLSHYEIVAQIGAGGMGEVYRAQFDVSKGGRFLIHVPPDAAAANVPITAIVNWQAGLKK